MNIAKKLVELLTEKGLHISTAESCTGGMIASSIVDISGASEVFEEGYVTYSDRVKQKVLGVRKETLEKYTAVSSETATEMAEGTCRVTGSDITVSSTGYAGPYDADDGTPAGTVYIGICYQGVTESHHYQFKGDRQEVRQQAVENALKQAVEMIER